MSYKPSIISPIDISGLAKKDGVIAFAKDIVSREDGIGAEFIRRRSAGQLHIGDGSAFMRSIKGKSLVWNQMVQKSDLPRQQSVSGVSLTLNGDGSITLNGTSNGQSQFSFASNHSLISGHKYYIKGGDISLGVYNIHDTVIVGVAGKYNTIFTAAASGTIQTERIYFESGKTFDDYTFFPQLFDLTQMFGAGNEPSTAAEFEALFPLPYYPYNEGEIVNLKAAKLLTNGFNQWDGSKARVLANNDYYIAGAYTAVKFSETLDGEQTDVAVNNRIFHIARNGFVFVTGADGTTCINFSNASLNGTYKPYEQHELTLPAGLTKTYTGADGQTHTWQGLDSAGSAYDEQTPTKNIQRIGVVDLGTLDCGYRPESARFRLKLTDISREGQYSGYAIANALCAKYATERIIRYSSFEHADKTLMVVGSGSDPDYALYIKDTAYSDVESFKAAMAGVLLFYELAEPIETEVPARNFNYFISDMGQEWILPEGVDEQGVPLTAPFNAVIAYASNVRDTIFHLPENYLSKESTIALLEAMKSANLIASYTMTFDTANNKYSFTITKAS